MKLVFVGGGINAGRKGTGAKRLCDLDREEGHSAFNSPFRHGRDGTGGTETGPAAQDSTSRIKR